MEVQRGGGHCEGLTGPCTLHSYYPFRQLLIWFLWFPTQPCYFLGPKVLEQSTGRLLVLFYWHPGVLPSQESTLVNCYPTHQPYMPHTYRTPRSQEVLISISSIKDTQQLRTLQKYIIIFVQIVNQHNEYKVFVAQQHCLASFWRQTNTKISPDLGTLVTNPLIFLIAREGLLHTPKLLISQN